MVLLTATIHCSGRKSLLMKLLPSQAFGFVRASFFNLEWIRYSSNEYTNRVGFHAVFLGILSWEKIFNRTGSYYAVKLYPK